MTLQKIFEEDIIEVSESVKDEQIEFSKALVLSKDRNFFNFTFDNNNINIVPGGFVETNNCCNYWNKIYAEHLKNDKDSTMWKRALDKHPLNTRVQKPEPTQEACYVFYILKSAAENNMTPPSIDNKIEKLSEAMKKFLEDIVPQPYTSLMEDRIIEIPPKLAKPKIGQDGFGKQMGKFGKAKSLGANPLILSSSFDLEIPG